MTLRAEGFLPVATVARRALLAISALGLGVGACSDDGTPSGFALIDRGSCDVLIACAGSLAPDARDAYEQTYGPNGTCWQTGVTNWPACRDFCASTLDTLNLVGMATGDTCGVCSSDSDCGKFGSGAECQGGICIGGDGIGGDGSGAEHADEGSDAGGDGDPTCTANHEVPEDCLRFVECIGAIVPDQRASTEAKYGANGSCWCGSNEEAIACFKTCIDEVDKAREAHPTVQACHKSSCTLDELDQTQPYGPIQAGSCPAWNPGGGVSYPQAPVTDPFGVVGSYCAPPCSGVTNACPQHPQTSASGTCSLLVGGSEHCSLRCYVDSTIIGGTQCHCGATCKPHGGPDGEGNQRGTCLF